MALQVAITCCKTTIFNISRWNEIIRNKEASRNFKLSKILKTYPILIDFLWRKNTGARRLFHFLHCVTKGLLLQSLVCLALTRVVLHRFLRAVSLYRMCTHGLFLIDICFAIFVRSVSSSQGYIANSLFESDFRTASMPFFIHRIASVRSNQIIDAFSRKLHVRI